jgi:hypothetical protein
MSREGISLLVIQRQLGHADLAITSRYLRGIDNTEIIAAVHERSAPMIPADPHVNGHLFLPIRGHHFSPVVAMISPHWWPSNLPTVRVARA